MKSGYVMEILRQRQGLECDDTSDDKFLQQFKPEKALGECCAWRFGDYSWAEWFIDAAIGCGFTVIAVPPELEVE